MIQHHQGQSSTRQQLLLASVPSPDLTIGTLVAGGAEGRRHLGIPGALWAAEQWAGEIQFQFPEYRDRMCPARPSTSQ